MLEWHEAEMNRCPAATALPIGFTFDRVKFGRNLDHLAAPRQEWSKLSDDEVVGVPRASQVPALRGMAGVRRKQDAGR
jgi:hypothetical protein